MTLKWPACAKEILRLHDHAGMHCVNGSRCGVIPSRRAFRKEEEEGDIFCSGLLWSNTTFSATSLKWSVLKQGQSQQWWDGDVSGFTDNDFI